MMTDDAAHDYALSYAGEQDYARIVAAYEAGFAAGVEQAAGVCDERAKVWDAQTGSVPMGISLKAHLATEAEACAAEIRALAAPVITVTGPVSDVVITGGYGREALIRALAADAKEQR